MGFRKTIANRSYELRFSFNRKTVKAVRTLQFLAPVNQNLPCSFSVVPLLFLSSGSTGSWNPAPSQTWLTGAICQFNFSQRLQRFINRLFLQYIRGMEVECQEHQRNARCCSTKNKQFLQSVHNLRG